MVQTHYKKLAIEPDTPGFTRPAWPAFLLDDKAVVFVRSDSLDFSAGAGGGAAITGTQQLVKFDATTSLPGSDLYIVDVASAQQTILAKAMGFNTAADAANSTTYLPFGTDDLHGNYLPTVSPVASGGYYWVFFDTIRNFGNLGRHRQLWGTAIDIRPDGNYTTDPSHPAFYLSGQDLSADNHRTFAAVDLCKPDGAPCSSGVDCCAGFCSESVRCVGEQIPDDLGQRGAIRQHDAGVVDVDRDPRLLGERRIQQRTQFVYEGAKVDRRARQSPRPERPAPARPASAAPACSNFSRNRYGRNGTPTL